MSVQLDVTLGVVFALAVSSFVAFADDTPFKGLSCKDHPHYKNGFKGELIRSWSYPRHREGVFYFSASGYIPRYSKHMWAPYDDKKSTKYRYLDYFVTYMQRKGPDTYLYINFQRKAKIYMFVSGFDERRPRVHLRGWRREGWAKLVHGDARERVQLGLMSDQVFPAPQHAYVFSKSARVTEPLPSMAWVSRNARGMKTNGYYHLLVAEADGSPVMKPESPEGINVTAAKRCPQKLHNMWKAPGRDTRDNQTNATMFHTYHPMWDPCYWCAYDHEHGSAAKQLMNYVPLYGYVALKNDNEDESHNGFKDFVLDTGHYRLYYSIHAHLSLPRRFFQRHHTVVIVIMDTKTKEKMLELSYKADFGFASTKAAAGGMLPLRAEDVALRKEQEAGNATKGFREVNVINPLKLDRRILYRHSGKNLLKGEYERWMAYPMCSDRKIRGPVADIKGAQNALRTTRSRQNDTVTLGRYLHGTFRPHVGVSRDLRFANFRMGWQHCGYGKNQTNGVFYTDPYGKKLLDGPAPNAVWQYMKPGFEIAFKDGIYMVDDTWLGLHKIGLIGGMHNIMNAIDPEQN